MALLISLKYDVFSVVFNSTGANEALLSWHFNDSVFFDRNTTNYAIAKKLY